MNQEDWSAFLKAKLDDRNPKCGNCRHWTMRHEDINPNVAASWGLCEVGSRAHTTDLSLCSAWEKAPKPDPE